MRPLARPGESFDDLQKRRWQAQERRYRRLARRAMAALPRKVVARQGAPSYFYHVPFDPDDAAGVKGAIAELAEAVRRSGKRRYFPGEPVRAVEQDVRLAGEGRAVRLLRYFDMEHGCMITRLDVALG